MAIKIVGSTIIDDSRNIVNAGVVTATSVSIGNSQVVSSGRQLQNILSLDNVTTDTIQKISGVRVAKDGTIVGFANTVNFSGVGLEVSPVVSGLSTVTVNGFPQVTNLLYVTKNGSDANDGRTLGKAKATIKGAVAAATEGTVIKVSAGTYIEDNPITLPNQVSVVGDSLREVSVTPQNQGDLFYVGEGNYIAEMAFVGPANPGAIFSFDPAAARYNAQSPYIQNCTNFIPDSIGLRIDGKLSIGPTKSMVLDSYTQYNQGGIGCSITNEGYAQLVSLFTICNEIAVYCGSGGACDLTNSNSSFGDYALVSDGVGPLKFTGLVAQAADANSDTFTIDLSTPNLGVVTARYDNGCGIVTITTSQPHKFNVGMGVSIVGLGFTCPSGPGILTYPSGKFGYNFEVKTVAPGRYVDAANRLRANRTEIQDKSLAAIAISHPDFYFPGDQQTTQYSRFYDSYRLIQQNKQEIVDKSLASIAVGFPTGFKFPDDPAPYERNRYYDASRLIQINKQEIIDRSLVSIAVGFPSSFYFPNEPQTNARSRYYDASRLIIINKQEIIDKSLGAVAIAHSDFYFPGDLQTNNRSRYFDAYRLIQRNKDVIVSIAWTNAYNVYPAIASSESKCKRDLGYFVDAISADVFTGGNNYSRQFTLQYFDGAGNPITNGLQGEEVASNYAFVEARELMKSAITNTLVGAAYSDLTITADPVTGFNTDPSSCANVRSNIDNLVGIVTTVIGAGNTSSLPSANLGYFNLSVGIGSTSSPGGFKCARDLEYLIDAVSTDVFTGGNRYSRDFTLQYFNNGSPISNGLVGETVESITAFNSARDLMRKAVTNQLNFKNLGISSGPATYGGPGIAYTVYQSGNEDSCTDVQSNINTLVGIVTTVIGSGSTSSLLTFAENLGISTTSKCARDIGYLVDAISTDVFTGGNKYSRDFTLQYFNNGSPISNGLLGEEAQSVVAFNAARDLMKKAVTNQLNAKNLGISSGPATYGGIGTSIVVLQSGNPNSCTDVQANINTLVGIVTTVIGLGTTASLSTFSENLGISTTNKCARDLGYFVDAFSTDIFTGGNSYTIAFTKFYFNNVGSATTALLGEESQSNYAFNSARDYAKKAITNQLNIKDLTLTADPVTGFNTSPNSCANVQSAINTLVSITTQAVGIGNLSTLNTITINPGIFVTGQRKCRRDIGYIVDAIADDLEGYTNKSILEATKSYFTISGAPRSNGLVGEVAESITAFRAIRDYSKKAINNLLNAQNLELQIDPAVNSNQNINGCADVYSTIDNLVGILTTYIGAGSLTGLPAVSLASTVFSANVGASTLPHTYVGGGTVKINTIRPFDGQVVYFGDLYYSVGKVVVSSGGTGYLTNTDIIIEEPETEWGIPATAVAEVVDGGVRNIEMISNGRGYKVPPKVTVLSPDVGINTAIAYAEMVPAYYVINSCTPITSSGICTITISDNVPYAVGVGTQAPFFKQSRLLASGHSLEYIGSGTEISKALPSTGGVAIQDNETVAKNGGLVVFTSTDQSGNFRIGDGVVINQQTGTISGTFYSKSLFSTMTPFILALGG